MDSRYEVIVVGGGPGGYALAIRLAQRGVRVALVEREEVGGVCLNWGCVPSKALITTSQRFRWALEGAAMGVRAEGVHVDLPVAQARSRRIVAHHTRGVRGLLKRNGATLIEGTARMLTHDRVAVAVNDDEHRELSASRAVVIATGARPRMVPGIEPDGERIVTAREAVFFEHLPEHLLVVGGGVIGLELGSAYLALGARVTVVELGPTLLPGIDSEMTKVVQRELVRRGADIRLGSRVTGVDSAQDGLTVRVADGSDETVVSCSHLLLAAGFEPNASSLGLGAVGVALDSAGHVRVDRRGATNVPGVYALGDVAGPPYLAHKAYKEAEVLADALTGRGAVNDARAMPSVIFCEPEVASVGLTEEEARRKHGDVHIGKAPFAAFARAQALEETTGFVKLIGCPEGRLVGAGVVGPEASELIAELTLAIEMGAELEDLALTVHAHPTLSEAVHEAAELALGRAVHLLNR